MFKKIMITLGSVVALLAVGFGSLVFYEMQRAPQTKGEKQLLALCLHGAYGQSRENCQCVMENARGKLTEDEMSTAWELQLGSRSAGFDRREAELETGRRYRALRGENARVTNQQETDIWRRIEREVEEEARAPQKRLRSIINSIVLDCGFSTE